MALCWWRSMKRVKLKWSAWCPQLWFTNISFTKRSNASNSVRTVNTLHAAWTIKVSANILLKIATYVLTTDIRFFSLYLQNTGTNNGRVQFVCNKTHLCGCSWRHHLDWLVGWQQNNRARLEGQHCSSVHDRSVCKLSSVRFERAFRSDCQLLFRT
jgi:hypothetical protein